MAGKTISGKEIAEAKHPDTFFRRVLGRILFQPLAINQNAEIARNTLNRTMIEGAVKGLVKDFPDTNEDYWLKMIADLKKEQGYDK